jgi:hypothetical protein
MRVGKKDWPGEYIPEKTVPWFDVTHYEMEPPSLGFRITWTKGVLPAVDIDIWNLRIQIGWFQP